MQLAALTGQQLLVDRLAQQRVAEGVAVGAVGHAQVVRDGLAQRRRQLGAAQRQTSASNPTATVRPPTAASRSEPGELGPPPREPRLGQVQHGLSAWAWPTNALIDHDDATSVPLVLRAGSNQKFVNRIALRYSAAVHGREWAWRRRRRLWVATVLALALWPATAPAATYEFVARADTHVDASTPTTSYGTASGVLVDASPLKQAYLRFDVSGLGDRTVTGVRLQMRAREGSVSGGRVFALSPDAWTEATTYQDCPPPDGPPLATIGPVATDGVYEVDLGPAVTGDGSYAFAIDSTSSDGVRWGSREWIQGPKLLIDATDSGLPIDGLAEVADGASASSSPTYYGSNHHLAMTSGGRLLAVHGRHANGVALKWRDPEGSWRSATLGASTFGMLLAGSGTGDWPASIAVGRDANGEEHAWAVWSRASYTYGRPVEMARLSNLDSPAGPTIGPVTTVDAPPSGAYRADVAIERDPDGLDRGVVLWTRRAADGSYEIVTGWFKDLAADEPMVDHRRVLLTSTNYARYGTLEPTPQGVRAVVRDNSSYVRVYAHALAAPLGNWSTAAGTNLTVGTPSASGLDSGALLVAFETSATNGDLRVQRFSPTGQPSPAELKLTGYTQPGIASDGTRAWLVMIRIRDGVVVSRSYDPTTGWAGDDRVEVGPEAGGGLAFPNTLRRTDGRLRFVVQGPGTSTTSATSVLGFQRPL